MLVGQPLADDTGQHLIRTIRVIEARRNAVAVAELELRQIAVQMLLAAMLLHAAHPAFEDAESAFNGVRGDVAAHVFLVIVMHRAMLRKLTAYALIHPRFVGHQAGFTRKIGKHDRLDFRSGLFDMDKAAATAVAIDQAEDSLLWPQPPFGLPAPALRPM